LRARLDKLNSVLEELPRICGYKEVFHKGFTPAVLRQFRRLGGDYDVIQIAH
jgi:hypothetical protein